MTSSVHAISGFAQGTSYLIRYASEYPIVRKDHVDALLDKLDSSLSLYKPFSLINQFNNSDHGMLPDDDLSNVVKKGIEISEITNGAFDITIKPLLNLWGFHQNKFSRIPSDNQVNTIKSHVGYKKLTWDGLVLKKSDPFVQLDCDGIAQGYSVDRLAAYMNSLGIFNYQIELGGEVFVSGRMPEDKFWKTSVDLLDRNAHPCERLLMLENEAVTTSGSFSKYSKLGNTYFSHIIDPVKGRPVQNGIISVTVIADKTVNADALDNAFMVMGISKAMQYVGNQTKIGLYILYRTHNGILRDTANPYFKEKIIPYPEALPHWQ